MNDLFSESDCREAERSREKLVSRPPVDLHDYQGCESDPQLLRERVAGLEAELAEAAKQIKAYTSVEVSADGGVQLDAKQFAYIRITFELMRMKAGELQAQRDDMFAALKAYERLDDFHANCPECDGLEQPELCEKCFPLADDARLKMCAAIRTWA